MQILGRGGQTLIAWVSWRVFAKFVSTSMEVKPVTYSTFRKIFIERESSLISLSNLTRDFYHRQRLRSKTAMLFIIFTMAYMIAFPTLASAMTGYTGKVGSFIPDKDRNLIPFTGFQLVLFVIHDGERIGLESNYIVTLPRHCTGKNLVRRVFMKLKLNSGANSGLGRLPGAMRLVSRFLCL